MNTIIPGSVGPISVMTGPSQDPSTAPMPGVELSSTSPAGDDPSAGIREQQSWTARVDLSNPENLHFHSQAPAMPEALPCTVAQTTYVTQVNAIKMSTQFAGGGEFKW